MRKGTMLHRGTTLFPVIKDGSKTCTVTGAARIGLRINVQPKPLGSHVQHRFAAGFHHMPALFGHALRLLFPSPRKNIHKHNKVYLSV